jgi:hypothetical protein
VPLKLLRHAFEARGCILEADEFGWAAQFAPQKRRNEVPPDPCRWRTVTWRATPSSSKASSSVMTSPLTGFVHAMRPAWTEGSQERSVVPYMFIARSALEGRSIAGFRHDPHVLDGAPLEHARRVNFPLEAARGNVNPAIVEDLKIPTSTGPAVHVG